MQGRKEKERKEGGGRREEEKAKGEKRKEALKYREKSSRSSSGCFSGFLLQN